MLPGGLARVRLEAADRSPGRTGCAKTPQIAARRLKRRKDSGSFGQKPANGGALARVFTRQGKAALCCRLSATFNRTRSEPSGARQQFFAEVKLTKGEEPRFGFGTGENL